MGKYTYNQSKSFTAAVLRKQQPYVWLLGVFLLFTCLYCGDNGRQDEIQASGTIEATEVVIRAKAGGEVIQLYVYEGDTAAKGAVLAHIDTTDYVLERRIAETARATAQAQLQLIKVGARKEDIDAAQEMVTQAEAEMSKIAADRKRFTALFEEKSITQSQLEEIETRYTAAEARYRFMVQTLTKLQNGPRAEEIDVVKAQVAQAQAAVDRALKRIADCTIISPITGTVVEQLIEQGELASPGRALFTLADLSRVKLTIFIKETELGKVRRGMNADVFIDSYPGRAFAGTVTFISEQAEFTPKNIQTKDERVKLVYKVEITVPNPEAILKSGMPADAVLKY